MSISVPLVALAGAAVGSIAAFDHHREESAELELGLGLLRSSG